MIRVGPAGWSYADWEGRVTPRRRPRGFHGLAHLARFVDLVELNTSFYALPRADHAARWAELVADRPRFRFSAKLYGEFTHAGVTHGETLAPEAYTQTVRAFRAGLAPLRAAGRLAVLLAQFPLAFRRSKGAVQRLERLAETFGGEALVLELRHASWFDAAGLRVLERLPVSLATIDLPSDPRHPPAATEAPQVGPIAYLRLHGRNSAAWFDPAAGRDQRYDYLYSPAEVTELARVARRLASGADETAVVTNNHFGGQAVANALELVGALDGSLPAAPAELVEAFPYLRGQVRVAGQDTLF